MGSNETEHPMEKVRAGLARLESGLADLLGTRVSTSDAGSADRDPATPPDWQQVTDDTQRLRVPGGWLYRVDEWSSDTGLVALALTFVPETP